MILLLEHLRGDGFIFRQDLAPSHRPVFRMNWLSQHQISIVTWSANSVDLNPAENMEVIMKKTLQDIVPKTKDELLSSLKSCKKQSLTKNRALIRHR